MMVEARDVKAQISPDTAGFRLLCPTRWTARSETISSIMTIMMSLEFWESLLDDRPDSETRARVNGLASQMKTFNFILPSSHCAHYYITVPCRCQHKHELQLTARLWAIVVLINVRVLQYLQ